MNSDSRTLHAVPEFGSRLFYDGTKRRRGSDLHMAVDMPGESLAVKVAPADAQDRAQVAEKVQKLTGKSMQLTYVDQGCTGEEAPVVVGQQGIRIEDMKDPGMQGDLVRLPRRWVAERVSTEVGRLRRLALDYKGVSDIPGRLARHSFRLAHVAPLYPDSSPEVNNRLRAL